MRCVQVLDARCARVGRAGRSKERWQLKQPELALLSEYSATGGTLRAGWLLVMHGENVQIVAGPLCAELLKRNHLRMSANVSRKPLDMPLKN
jgi:hypothetical protein